MTASRTVLTASERNAPARRRVGSARLTACDPAVAESCIVVDMVELRVSVAELLADALDERPDIGAEPLRAIAGDEILAVDEIIDLAIGDVLAGAQGEQRHDLELGQRQVERLAGPVRAADVEAQLQLVEMEDVADVAPTVGINRRARSLGDEAQALHQDRKAPRLVDEIDGAAFERRLLVDVVAQHGQEDDGGRRAGPPEAAQDF